MEHIRVKYNTFELTSDHWFSYAIRFLGVDSTKFSLHVRKKTLTQLKNRWAVKSTSVDCLRNHWPLRWGTNHFHVPWRQQQHCIFTFGPGNRWIPRKPLRRSYTFLRLWRGKPFSSEIPCTTTLMMVRPFVKGWRTVSHRPSAAINCTIASIFKRLVMTTRRKRAVSLIDVYTYKPLV